MDNETIIGLFWDRDETALAQVREHYGAYMLYIARNLLRDDRDVEECMNDLFMSLWNSIPPVVPRIFRAFAAKITRNLALKMYEKKKTLKRDHSQVSQTIEELAECIASGENTQAHIEHKEVIAALNEFLGTLDDKKCRLFMQRYFYMKPIKDIAEENGISAGSLKTLLCRTRADLRKFIEERDLY